MKQSRSPASLGFGLLVASLGAAGSFGCSSAPALEDLAGGAAGMVGAAGSATAGAPAAGAGGSSSGAAGTAGSGGGSGVPVDCSLAGTVPVSVAWSAINAQGADFYASPEALTLGDNILYYQNADGGWPKAVDMTTRTAAKARSTIDNRATTTQLEFLARVYAASGCATYGEGVTKGLGYLLDAQYENGGWPQEYPEPDGYHAHITFNDDAMVRVLELLRSVSLKSAPYTFVDDALAANAASAVESGIDCILKTQIVVDGQKTGWCAQHDEVTLEPALARTYELPSLSGSEGVGIVRFLMGIEQPSEAVREAIEGAVAWFEQVKLTGIKVVETVDPSQPTGEDRVVVEDPAAPPIWARFYELETNRPIFSSRCEVEECESDPFFMRRYSLAEIDHERRVGYSWYGDWPATLLSRDYPNWLARSPAP